MSLASVFRASMLFKTSGTVDSKYSEYHHKRLIIFNGLFYPSVEGASTVTSKSALATFRVFLCVKQKVKVSLLGRNPYISAYLPSWTYRVQRAYCFLHTGRRANVVILPQI